jgi:hypothetical protein
VRKAPSMQTYTTSVLLAMHTSSAHTFILDLPNDAMSSCVTHQLDWYEYCDDRILSTGLGLHMTVKLSSSAPSLIACVR